MTYGVGPYAKLPYSVPLEIVESGGGGGGTSIPIFQRHYAALRRAH